MTLKIAVTEFKRDWFNSISIFILSLFLGFTLFFVVGTSNYLNKIFDMPKWNVDLVILPKAVTPELALANLTKGQPDALIPKALFNTLLEQSESSSVKILGFIPYMASNGKSEIAVTDSELKNFSDLKQNSFWSDFNLTDINQKSDEFKPSEFYSTQEWKDQVLFGIVAKGSASELSNLQNLINRRTIAQAFFVDENNNASTLKLQQLKKGLFVTTGFVSLSTTLGLFLAIKNMNVKTKSLEVVLKELRFKPQVLLQVKLMQMLVLILIPALLGYLLSNASFDLIQKFIF